MQTVQFKVDNNYINIVLNLLNSLNGLKLNVINDLLIVDNKKEMNITSEKEELKSFSNHTANLIDDWKDTEEDSIWI
ncbi:hypothetical protein KKC13_00290 [bacterium]|nr:hypothetical protein [bacterium]MBU1958477.1 hypothetical protein [bacterium]